VTCVGCRRQGSEFESRLGALNRAWYVPAVGGVGAPSVTWVLDERGVVGDNILDRVSPAG
ncbi:MAG: hypothetical protein M3Y91_19275, partial [Actinomycetota bacterium]|nr:hypothetical protein [Actinomycetota bacterium]